MFLPSVRPIHLTIQLPAIPRKKQPSQDVAFSVSTTSRVMRVPIACSILTIKHIIDYRIFLIETIDDVAYYLVVFFLGDNFTQVDGNNIFIH